MPEEEKADHATWTSDDLAKLHSWLYCVCIVEFDLSEGQRLKFAYPIDILSEGEKHNIAHLAFPDTNAHSGQEIIDSYFCFRFRCQLMSDFADSDNDNNNGNNDNNISYNDNGNDDDDEENEEDKIVSKLSKMSEKEKELYFEGISHRKMYNDSYLFGFSYFRQRKDDKIDRGFFQQSIVIVTPLPYISVFKQCMEIIGPLYFDHGMNIIDSACRNILLWPTPATRGNVSLPILGNVINVILSPHIVPMSAAITNKHKKYQKELKRQQLIKQRQKEKGILIQAQNEEQQSNNNNDKKHKNSNNGGTPRQRPSQPPPPPPPPPPARYDNDNNDNNASSSSLLDEITNGGGNVATELLSNWSTHPDGGCFQEINIYKYFRSVLGNLWFLWEIALTGEPLMIITPTAEECSQAVLGIMSLISPITYNGDFRPYFTIYDSDFKHFSDLHDRKMLPSLILGVTNPFFLKTMPNMPNVLIINNESQNTNTTNNTTNSQTTLNSPSMHSNPETTMSIPRANSDSHNSSKNVAANTMNGDSLNNNNNDNNNDNSNNNNNMDESKSSGNYNMGDITDDGFVNVSSPVSQTPKSNSKSFSNNSQSLASPHASMSALNTENVVTVHVRQQSKSKSHKTTIKRKKNNMLSSKWNDSAFDIEKSFNTIISKTTPCLVPDQTILSRLLTVSKAVTSDGVEHEVPAVEVEQINAINNAMLRKYFQSMTERFLEPFKEYFTFRVPSGYFNPYLNAPTLKTFDKEAFLNYVRDLPRTFSDFIPLSTSVTGKRTILIKLYSKFLESPHFPGWFSKHRDRAKRLLDRKIHKMIRKIPFTKMVEGRPVREGIQMYNSIHKYLTFNIQSAKPKADLNEILIRHRSILRSALPTQIVNALDERQEKIRENQIERTKQFKQKLEKERNDKYNNNNNNRNYSNVVVSPKRTQQNLPPPPPRNSKGMEKWSTSNNNNNSNNNDSNDNAQLNPTKMNQNHIESQSQRHHQHQHHHQHQNTPPPPPPPPPKDTTEMKSMMNTSNINSNLTNTNTSTSISTTTSTNTTESNSAEKKKKKKNKDKKIRNAEASTNTQITQEISNLTSTQEKEMQVNTTSPMDMKKKKKHTRQEQAAQAAQAAANVEIGNTITTNEKSQTSQ